VTDALVHLWLSGGVWHVAQRLAAGPGGHFVPSVASWSEGRLDVFTVTSSGSLAQFWFDGRRWLGWSDQGKGPGGVALVAPAAVAAWGPGRLDVFALARAGRVLAHKWYAAGWSGPQDLGTGPDRIGLVGLGATSWGTGRLDVLAVDGQPHSAVQFYFNGHWNGPVRQDFPTTGAVTATGTLSVMADPAPRATPIPVDHRARAAD